MHKVFEIASGVCLGAMMTILSVWLLVMVIQMVAGDRYFTPSQHIIKKKMIERMKEVQGKLDSTIVDLENDNGIKIA